MDETSFFHQQSPAADGRREALRWLARRLNWERRLGELRPGRLTERRDQASCLTRAAAHPGPPPRPEARNRPRPPPAGVDSRVQRGATRVSTSAWAQERDVFRRRRGTSLPPKE